MHGNAHVVEEQYFGLGYSMISLDVKGLYLINNCLIAN